MNRNLCAILCLLTLCLSSCAKQQKTTVSPFSVIPLENQLYQYRVCGNDGTTAFQRIAVKYEPTGTMLSDDLLQIRTFAGTGTWFTQYFDTETKLLSPTYECDYYVAPNLTVYFVYAPDGTPQVIVSDIWGTDRQTFSWDGPFETANIITIIRSITPVDGTHLSFLYLNSDGTEETLVIEHHVHTLPQVNILQ